MIEKYNGIDLSMFGEYCKKHAQLLNPCFQFQRRLRAKCVGGSFWKKQEKKRKKRFNDKTWTDIYEELKETADDEIRRAEEYRKSKHKRALKNRIKMGFFKLPKPGLFATVPAEPKKPKPKFLNKRLREKERYEVMDELFDNVHLRELESKNNAILDLQKLQAKDGEFAHTDSLSILERSTPGAFHLGFHQLTEIAHLRDELMGKEEARVAELKRRNRKKEKEPEPRGLFDYEFYDYKQAQQRRSKEKTRSQRRVQLALPVAPTDSKRQRIL